MAILPIPGNPASGVNLARANEVQFIGAKRKPLRNEGQGPLNNSRKIVYVSNEHYFAIMKRWKNLCYTRKLMILRFGYIHLLIVSQKITG
jgi:hypothetical protein